MNINRRVWAIAGAFSGYWGLGSLSGFFAIPPGYASPIWPAAGFALLMIIEFGPWALVGVVFASFLLNLGFSHASILEPSPVWIDAGFIAFGAALQTLLAYFLVRRFTRFPDLMARTNDPIRLALLGGPVACTVSCSVGVATLFLSGIIPWEALLGNWLNWWIGDSIGVMTLAPVILVVNSKQKWSSKTTALSFIGFYFVLVLIASIVFVQSRTSSENSANELFDEHVDGITSTILKQTDNITHASYTLAALFGTFHALSFDQFREYSKVVYEHIPGTHALSWVPIVHREDRQHYEQAMAEYLRRPYVFQQIGADKKLEPATDRAIYYPVYYIAPLETNARAAGLDLGSNPARLAAILKAEITRNIVATEPIVLVQESGDQLAFLLLTPVLSNGSVTGFISCVFRAGDLIDAAIEKSDLLKISVVITDITDRKKPEKLYADAVLPTDYHVERTIDFAFRKWRLTFSPGSEYLNRNQGLSTWAVLVAGFLIVSVVGLFVLLMMSQKSAVENEVLVKTGQLQDALAHAESANKVKGNFLASMSHELRTPLNSIIGFSVRSLKKMQGSGQERVIESLSLIEKNGRYLLSLINDILDLSKIDEGKMVLVKTDVVLVECCEEVVASLVPMAEAKGLTLVVEPGHVVTLRVDAKRFKQILVNLLSNAIKFTQSGSITVRWHKALKGDKQGVCLQVVDTGAGISAADMKRLFMRFEQLGADFKSQDMGSGLGLSLVLELVTMHGGTINVESAVGTGSVFNIWFPEA